MVRMSRITPLNPPITMSSERLTTADVAAMTGLSPRTIQRMRKDGSGPAWHRMGSRRAYYAREDVLSYIASRRSPTETEAGTTLNPS
jgi:predicted DNA-binding transcriptional regulator AlpA